MLNQSGIKTVHATTGNGILIDTATFVALSTRVHGEPNKVVKAGNPITGTTMVMGQTNVFKADGEASSVIGMLLHDVQLDDQGYANATALLSGFVDFNKLDEATQALVSQVGTKVGDVKIIKY